MEAEPVALYSVNLVQTRMETQANAGMAGEGPFIAAAATSIRGVRKPFCRPEPNTSSPMFLGFHRDALNPGP